MNLGCTEILDPLEKVHRYKMFWTVHMFAQIAPTKQQKKFLRQLQHPNTVSNKEPPTLTSLSDYREYWKRIKENMSSQGTHIGMYRAAA